MSERNAGPLARPPLWLTEADVCAVLDLVDSIDVIRSAFAGEPAGKNWAMAKTYAAWAGNTLHALGGGMSDDGVVGTKTWAHTASGAAPLLILWDASTGAMRAVIEAFALGQLRTAAVTGVATDVLSSPGAEVAAVIGTGKQALAQAAALVAVRDIRLLRYWSPSPRSRSRFADALHAADLGVEVREASGIETATAGAEIVTTVTRARDPFLTAELVHGDAHINAVGAIGPDRCELTPDLVASAALVVSDSPAAARTLSCEVTPVEEIRSLGEVMAGSRELIGKGLTLFKAVGSGLADVALGGEALRRAAASGAGRTLAEPLRQRPTLRRRQQ